VTNSSAASCGARLLILASLTPPHLVHAAMVFIAPRMPARDRPIVSYPPMACDRRLWPAPIPAPVARVVAVDKLRGFLRLPATAPLCEALNGKQECQNQQRDGPRTGGTLRQHERHCILRLHARPGDFTYQSSCQNWLPSSKFTSLNRKRRRFKERSGPKAL